MTERRGSFHGLSVRPVFAVAERAGDPGEPIAPLTDERAVRLWPASEHADLQGYFNSDKTLAILANVGTLVQPTTQATYPAVKNLPANLFSHSDQQDQWQTAQLSGTTAAGWAGKIADNVQTLDTGTNSLPSFRFPAIPSSHGNYLAAFLMNPGQHRDCEGSVCRLPHKPVIWLRSNY